MVGSLSETCWIWTRGRFANGYGQAWKHGAPSEHKGKYGRPIQAHRLVYEFFEGPIPAEMQLDHVCRQRGCVNPAHLRVVTCRENIMADRSKCEAAKNAAKTHCARSHELSGANLYVRNGKRYCRTCKRETKRALRAAGRTR